MATHNSERYGHRILANLPVHAVFILNYFFPFDWSYRELLNCIDRDEYALCTNALMDLSGLKNDHKRITR